MFDSNQQPRIQIYYILNEKCECRQYSADTVILLFYNKISVKKEILNT